MITQLGHNYWLVGQEKTPRKNDGLRQLGWWHSNPIYEYGKILKTGNQTTNQTRSELTFLILLSMVLGQDCEVDRNASHRFSRKLRHHAPNWSVQIGRGDHLEKSALHRSVYTVIPEGRVAFLPSSGSGRFGHQKVDPNGLMGKTGHLYFSGHSMMFHDIPWYSMIFHISIIG